MDWSLHIEMKKKYILTVSQTQFKFLNLLVYNSYDILFTAVLFLFLFSVTSRFSCMFDLQAFSKCCKC